MTAATAKREANPALDLNGGFFRMLPSEVDEKELVVDRTGGSYRAGVIRNVSLISEGEALGHKMWIDDTTLEQVSALANRSNKGVKARFTHPSMSADGLGRHLGRVTDTYVSAGKVYGDLHFSKSSHETPEGDLASYVMGLAEEDPQAAGLSIVFNHDAIARDAFVDAFGGDSFESPDPRNEENYPHVRIETLRAADVVDEPAANPDGLFDRQDLPRAMSDLMDYAAGLSDTPPAPVLGIDPDRASAFLSRWLADHQLTLSEPKAMTNENVQPEAKPAEVSRDDVMAELSKFTSAFGPEHGTEWFQNGDSYEQALENHVKLQAEKIEHLAAQIVELEDKLASISLGEEEPVEGSLQAKPAEKKSPFRFVDSTSEN